MKNKYVLNQILGFITRYEFNKAIHSIEKPITIKRFSHWEHFICLSYGQIAQKQSIRAIILGLTSRPNKLYHLGIRSTLSLSTLSYANRNRNWIIYKNLAYVLIRKVQLLNNNRKTTEFKAEANSSQENESFELLNKTIYALDASTITLCLSIFPWATFRKKKWYQITYTFRFKYKYSYIYQCH